MKHKKKLLLALLFIAIILGCFYSVRSFDTIELIDVSEDIRQVESKNTITFEVPINSYLFKLKLFKKENDTLAYVVYVNDKKIEAHKKKEKAGYIKLYYQLKKEFLNNGKNTITITFNDACAENVFYNISNYSKKIWEGIIILPGETTIASWWQGSFVHIILILLIAFVAGVLFISLRYGLKKRNAVQALAALILPFSFFNLVLIGSFFVGYKIIITPFLYIFISIVSVCVVISFVISARLYKAIKLFMRKNNFVKLIFFVMSSLLMVFAGFFLVGEFVSRIYCHYLHPVKVFTIADNCISYELTPSAELEFAGSRVKINQDGFRGCSPQIIKEKDSTRIALIGDSMVFGFGVGEEATLTHLLSSSLLNDDYKTDVLNLAISGHNFRQEKLFFIGKGLRYHPDVLIYGFCLNDIGGNLFVPTGFNTLLDVGTYNYSYDDFSFMEKVQYALLRKSYFYQYLVYKWKIVVNKLFKENADYSNQTLLLMEGAITPELSNALDAFKKDILELQQICKANKIEFVIMAYGTDAQMDDENLLWPQRWLEQFTQEYSIYFLDLLPAFKNYSKDLVLIDEGHPSAFGNEILAEYLRKYLIEIGLLKD